MSSWRRFGALALRRPERTLLKRCGVARCDDELKRALARPVDSQGALSQVAHVVEAKHDLAAVWAAQVGSGGHWHIFAVDREGQPGPPLPHRRAAGRAGIGG